MYRLRQMSFEQAVNKANQAKTLGKHLSNDQLLQLYGYYKVATVGPNTTPKPSMLNFRESAKWTAWKTVSGMNRESAKAKYVELVNQWC